MTLTLLKKTSALVAALVMGAACAADGDYKPEEWNVKARRQFANQRFGIFIHWGLYANYAQGEWYVLGQDEAAYSRMMDGFYPSKFDAKEWVKLFKEAGAKYVTFTSRHHDGFSMWPTKVDDGYNIANSPFKRDIVGELASACKEEGLQFNLYYSLMDWHRKDYPVGGTSCNGFVPGRKADYPSYKKFMMGQLKELVENYRPGVVWFDGEWDHATFDKKKGEWVRTLDWGMDEIYDYLHSEKVLTANNNHQPIRAREDIQAFEIDLPCFVENSAFAAHQPMTMDRPIEQCNVIQHNVWGYRITERSFRNPQSVIQLAVRAASKGVNLLINVGPDGSGRIPAKTVEVLKRVGEWFKLHGESIYGTDACPFADGDTLVSTRRDNVVYLHYVNEFAKKPFTFPKGVEVEKAEYIGGEFHGITAKEAPVKREADGRYTVGPAARPHAQWFDIVIKVTLK